MKIFVVIVINIETNYADQNEWSEEKIGKFAVKASRAANYKKWGNAIKHGEKWLEGATIFYGEESPLAISCLKTVNRYYDKAGRLNEIPERVKKAYQKSKTHFSLKHDTTVMSRLLYYKLLISNEHYEKAIPLVYENISILTETVDDQFRHLHYLKQLYSLYGAINQFASQETVLIKQLNLNKKLVGADLEDNIDIIMNLARSYCQQNKAAEFQEIIRKYNLKYAC